MSLLPLTSEAVEVEAEAVDVEANGVAFAADHRGDTDAVPGGSSRVSNYKLQFEWPSAPAVTNS